MQGKFLIICICLKNLNLLKFKNLPTLVKTSLLISWVEGRTFCFAVHLTTSHRNQHPPVNHEGWMVQCQKNRFLLGSRNPTVPPPNLGGQLSCFYICYLLTTTHLQVISIKVVNTDTCGPYKASTYLVVTYFPTYLSIHRTYFLHNGLRM